MLFSHLTITLLIFNVFHSLFIYPQILDPSKEALANGCETILLHATDTNFEL